MLAGRIEFNSCLITRGDVIGRIKRGDQRRCARVIGVSVLGTTFYEFNRSETMPLVELLLQGFEMGGWAVMEFARSITASAGRGNLLAVSELRRDMLVEFEFLQPFLHLP
ncbi:hypothetical protein L1887_20151 [Cichorium endivia]|nr:hypothetical protein L1887_20151 [Cichorium endivia]